MQSAWKVFSLPLVDVLSVIFISHSTLSLYLFSFIRYLLRYFQIPTDVKLYWLYFQMPTSLPHLETFAFWTYVSSTYIILCRYMNKLILCIIIILYRCSRMDYRCLCVMYLSTHVEPEDLSLGSGDNI